MHVVVFFPNKSAHSAFASRARDPLAALVAVARERPPTRDDAVNSVFVFVSGSDGRQERGEAQRTHPAGVSREFMFRADAGVAPGLFMLCCKGPVCEIWLGF